MVNIGGVGIGGRLFLAPMAGVTDAAYRLMCREHGAALCSTEMISSKALMYQDAKTRTLLLRPEGDGPLAVQIFGSDPVCMGEAAQKALELCHAELVDINMGCPVGKVVRAGITQDMGGVLAGPHGSDGSAVISHVTARSDALRDLTSLTVNTAFAVGLRSDGTVVSPAVELPGWKDILAVSSSGTGILGLRGDGTVASVFFRPQDDPGVSAVRNALAVAAGGTHCAFLREDGSVQVLGGTGKGENATEGWDLLGGGA